VTYSEIIERRRALRFAGYQTLAEVGFDGPWVTPYQKTSRSPDGPVLVALHWLDGPSIGRHRDVLEKHGYLPGIRFNVVLDLALGARQLNRGAIYVTQAFHLVPEGRSESVPSPLIDESFDEVTRHEVAGRRVLALGDAAARACARHGIRHVPVCHPAVGAMDAPTRTTRSRSLQDWPNSGFNRVICARSK
jgi:hypothetical protein